MAELLVRAQSSSNQAATELGDIIVVREDGWTWGNAECLPEYLIVKLPGISVETVEHFQQQLLLITGESSQLVKRRKWHIPQNWINQRIKDGNTVVTINVLAQKQALIDSMLEKLV